MAAQSQRRQIAYRAIFARMTANKTIANTTTETTLFGTLSPPSTPTLAKNELKVKDEIRVKIRGVISSAAAAQGNLTINLKYGSTVIATGVLALGANMSGELLDIDIIASVLTVGASGTIMACGRILCTLLGVATVDLIAPATPTTATTVDTTAAGTLDCTATFSAALASNTLTTTIGSIEIIDGQ